MVISVNAKCLPFIIRIVRRSSGSADVALLGCSLLTTACGLPANRITDTDRDTKELITFPVSNNIIRL